MVRSGMRVEDRFLSILSVADPRLELRFTEQQADQRSRSGSFLVQQIDGWSVFCNPSRLLKPAVAAAVRFGSGRRGSRFAPRPRESDLIPPTIRGSIQSPT